MIKKIEESQDTGEWKAREWSQKAEFNDDKCCRDLRTKRSSSKGKL